jgi:hypothetical protein
MTWVGIGSSIFWAWPWNGRHYDLPKCRYLLTRRHRVTSSKIWTFSNTTTRTSYIAVFTPLPWATGGLSLRNFGTQLPNYCPQTRRWSLLGMRSTSMRIIVVNDELLESSWNVMAHGDAREGKWRGNWRNGVGSQYSSHYLGIWCIQHYYRWCAQLGYQ